MLQEQACHAEDTSFIGPTIDFQSLTEVQLIDLLEMEFSVEISTLDALTILHDLHSLVEKNAQTENNNHTWVSKQSRNTLLIWLKSKLNEKKYFLSTVSDEDRLPNKQFSTVKLNIGFTHLLETDEMKELLRRPETGEQNIVDFSSAARSRITKTLQFIQPINAVTHKVARPPYLKKVEREEG